MTSSSCGTRKQRPCVTKGKSCRAYRAPQRPPTKHAFRFSIASSVVVAIVFVIVVDDTIHFLSNWLEGGRKGGWPRRMACARR